MMNILQATMAFFKAFLVDRTSLAAENMALRHQLTVLQRSVKRPKLHKRDRTFRVLYCFVVLRHHRRQVVHFNVTPGPTAQWAARQITQAFPYDSAPRFLLRDRDGVHGSIFRRRVENMGIEEVLTAYRSPWQNPYAERLIGSIRRDCLDHVVVLGEGHLRKILKEYFTYYNRGPCAKLS